MRFLGTFFLFNLAFQFNIVWPYVCPYNLFFLFLLVSILIIILLYVSLKLLPFPALYLAFFFSIVWLNVFPSNLSCLFLCFIQPF